MADECDSVWLVVADRSVQKERLMRRRGLSAEEAELRLTSQPDESARRAQADVVIENSGSEADLERRVDNAWQVVKQLTN